MSDKLYLDTNSRKEVVFESMSGVNTSVILEFPSSNNSTSAFIALNSLVTIAYSVYRAKIPVFLAGSNTISGFSLGNKTVAGSIIKTLTFQDDLTSYLEFYRGESLAYKDKNSTPNLGTKMRISQKEFDSIMRDDLTPFNIYCYNISEYTGHIVCDAIYGATIVNNGQVQSIENLITENTISFVAHSVRQAHDVTAVSPSIPSLSTVTSGSSLLKRIKK